MCDKENCGSRYTYSAKRVEEDEEMAKNRILEVTCVGQMEKDTEKELSREVKGEPMEGGSQRFKKARSFLNETQMKTE